MNELTLLERELVPVYVTDKGEYVVNGRELWETLKSKRQFANWIEKRLNECDAKENEDYEVFNKFVKNPKGGRPLDEYIIKLDIAKEMAMLERNEIGKKVRKHFIEIEKRYYKQNFALSREELFSMAFVEAQKVLTQKDKEIEIKNQIISELKPRADYTDLVLKSKSLVTINQIAQDYGMSAYAFNKALYKLGIQYKQSGQWLLYQQYRGKGYVQSETIYFKHSDGRPDVNMITKWTTKGRLFLYNILKENGILPTIEKDISELQLQS